MAVDRCEPHKSREAAWLLGMKEAVFKQKNASEVDFWDDFLLDASRRK